MKKTINVKRNSGRFRLISKKSKGSSENYFYEEVKAGIEGIGVNAYYLDLVIEQKYGIFPSGGINRNELNELYSEILSLEATYDIEKKPEERKVTRPHKIEFKDYNLEYIIKKDFSKKNYNKSNYIYGY